MATACGGGMIPSCCPVSSITRTSRTRIRSLVRMRSSRRGERSNAIMSSSAKAQGLRPGACSSRLLLGHRRRADEILAPDFVDCVVHERADGSSAEHTRRPAPYRDSPLRHFAIPDDKHVGDLLQLGLSDLIANLLHATVQFDTN